MCATHVDIWADDIRLATSLNKNAKSSFGQNYKLGVKFGATHVDIGTDDIRLTTSFNKNAKSSFGQNYKLGVKFGATHVDIGTDDICIHPYQPPWIGRSQLLAKPCEALQMRVGYYFNIAA